MNDQLDTRVRAAAFNWLDSQRALHGDVLPWRLLLEGFAFDGQRVPLVAQQGIFKPRLCALPLSLRTSPGGPYSDSFRGDSLRYAYRGENADHRDNVGLRQAMARRVPLIYFFGVVPGRYLSVWPVFIVGDDPTALFFDVQVDDARMVQAHLAAAGNHHAVADPRTEEIRRGYITATVQRRLHQEAFRQRVLHAYREQCSLCRLKHDELLDAAHITPDSDDAGDPLVSNGLALCKLHHAAFDRHFLTIRPDYVIQVQRRILEEEDGPMLLHGLKGMHDQRIQLPRSRRDWPDPARLEARWQLFAQARG